VFPNHLKEVPPYLEWIKNSITTIVKKEDKIEKDVVHVSMPPTFEAKNYRIMWVFGNHIGF
jgi:septum formation topological specificity factor MinE